MTTRADRAHIKTTIRDRPYTDLLEAYDQIHTTTRTPDDTYLDRMVTTETEKRAVDENTTKTDAELLGHLTTLSRHYLVGAAASPSWKLRVRTAVNEALRRHPDSEQAMAHWENNPEHDTPLDALLADLKERATHEETP